MGPVLIAGPFFVFIEILSFLWYKLAYERLEKQA